MMEMEGRKEGRECCRRKVKTSGSGLLLFLLKVKKKKTRPPPSSVIYQLILNVQVTSNEWKNTEEQQYVLHFVRWYLCSPSPLFHPPSSFNWCNELHSFSACTCLNTSHYFTSDKLRRPFGCADPLHTV